MIRVFILALSVMGMTGTCYAVKPTPLDLSVAPNLSMKDFNGKQYNLRQFRGKMVALHFWASWCVPCRVEMPTMEAFIKNNPDAVVIPMSVDRDAQAAMRFLDQVNLSIPLMFTSLNLARKFGVYAIPTTIILDKDGRFLYKVMGAAPWGSDDFKDLMLGFISRLP